MTQKRASIEELVFDWNTIEAPEHDPRDVEFDDETLRDGLQSPSVNDPSVKEKLEILHLMADIGIQAANIGLPGAGPRSERDALALAKEIVDKKLNIKPNCAARTLIRDIEPIVRIAQASGIPIEAATFIGSSPIRLHTEGWTVDRLLRATEEAVTFAVKEGLPVMYVTEDTTRAHPDVIEKLFTTAIECGARRLCVCDTVGHSTPHGVRNLIHFVLKVIEKSGEDVAIDWHGHCDRGMAIHNALEAIETGVSRVHGTALAVGERCGNVPMDLLLVNLKLLGWIDNDLTLLTKYCRTVSRSLDVPIPANYPVFGRDAFRTATGVHAAAVIKALKRDDKELADWVYSGVPAGMFGRRQRIEVGPMSGASNVSFWLTSNGHDASDELVQEILSRAKQSKRILTDHEMEEIVSTHTVEG